MRAVVVVGIESCIIAESGLLLRRPRFNSVFHALKHIVTRNTKSQEADCCSESLGSRTLK